MGDDVLTKDSILVRNTRLTLLYLLGWQGGMQTGIPLPV